MLNVMILACFGLFSPGLAELLCFQNPIARYFLQDVDSISSDNKRIDHSKAVNACESNQKTLTNCVCFRASLHRLSSNADPNRHMKLVVPYFVRHHIYVVHGSVTIIEENGQCEEEMVRSFFLLFDVVSNSSPMQPMLIERTWRRSHTNFVLT